MRGDWLMARVAPAAGRESRAGREGADEARTGERRLVREAQQGSSEALETLFRTHWPGAYRAAYFIVRDAAAAEDIAQEAFLSAVRALDRFDRRRPFAPWVHRIVVNRSIDFARARALRREVDVEPAEAAAAPPERPTGLSEALFSALARLGPDQRAVVVLRYLLGCTPGEIARALEIPRGTVNSRLRRALDLLAESVDRDT